MRQIKSDISYFRSWLPWGYTARLFLELACESDDLNKLARNLFHSDYIEQLQNSYELYNYRGSDEGELLSVEGQFISAEDSDQEDAVDKDFRIQLCTNYHSSNARQVKHEVSQKRLGSFSELVQLKHLPDKIPANIHKLDFSIIKYNPRSVTGYFGFSPINTGHIFLKCTTEKILLEIKEDGLTNKACFPWEKEPAFIAIQAAFLQCGIRLTDAK